MELKKPSGNARIVSTNLVVLKPAASDPAAIQLPMPKRKPWDSFFVWMLLTTLAGNAGGRRWNQEETE
jgi:hypothetical protein